MDLRDYLVMLKRGWPTIVALALIGVALASAYLTVTPRSYQSSTTLLLTPERPADIQSAASGAQLAGLLAPTYAGLIRSPAVLDSVSTSLRPQIDPDELSSMIAAGQRPETSLIDVIVTGSDPVQAADIANLVAEAAAAEIPALIDAQSADATLEVERINVAVVPTAPVSPSTRPILAIGLIVGTVAGIGIALARQALDTRIRTAADLRRSGAGLLLGSVPASPGQVVTAGGQFARLAESYRGVRTALGVGRVDLRRSVLVAPVRESRGSHLVAANLAASIAQTNRSVVLVDLDLRTGPVQGAFQIEVALGVGDVIADRVALSDAVVAIPDSHLTVLVAGTSQPHPSDLLGSEAVGILVRELEARYDHVIANAPALLAYPDGSVVAPEFRTVVLSMVDGKATFAQLSTATDALRNIGVEPAGSVIVGRRLPWLAGFGRTQSGSANRYRAWRTLDGSRAGRRNLK